MRTLGPRLLALISGLCLCAGAAEAHGGEAHTLGWTFDPWIVVPLAVSGLIYGVGTATLWRRAGLGRGIRTWQVGAYAAGWLSLAGALMSPLHWLGEHLFTAHMVEHEIVMAVSAPLLALARPIGAFLWAFPASVRHRIARAFHGRSVRAIWQVLTRPRIATILHGVAIWAWHVPALFDMAVEHVVMHRLQHVTFLATALLFWWALVRRCNAGQAAGHLFVTMLHTGVLGALMALAPRVLYRAQTAHALEWGLTPLEDQQLAGFVMWIPAGTVYAGAALLFAAYWINRSGRMWKDEHAL